MRKEVSAHFGVLLAASLLFGCAAPNGTATATISSNRPSTQNPVLSRPARQAVSQFEKLVAAKKFEDAEAQFDSIILNFGMSLTNFGVLTNSAAAQLASYLNEQYAGRLRSVGGEVAALSDAPPTSQWPTIKKSLGAARDLIEEYSKHKVLAAEEARSTEFGALSSAYAKETAALQSRAVDEFWAYEKSGESNFFDQYPTELVRSDFFSSPAFLGSTSGRTFADLRKLVNAHREIRLTPIAYASISDAAFDLIPDAVDPKRPQPRPSPVEILNAFIDDGFTLDAVPNGIDIVSTTSAQSGEFSVDAGVEGPRPIRSVNLNTIRETATRFNGRVRVVVVPYQTTLSRRVESTDTVHSTFLAGYQSQPNPAYTTALIEAQTAQQAAIAAQYNTSITANNPYAGGFAALGAAIGQIGAAQRYQEAMQRLQNTPQTIQTAVHSDYTFSRTKVSVSKQARLNFIVTAKGDTAAYVLGFDFGTSKSFDIASGLNPKDDRYTSGFSSDQDLANFSSQSVAVSKKQVIDAVVAGANLKKHATFELALAAATAVSIPVSTPTKDLEKIRLPEAGSDVLKSIVVVQTGDGMGAGFYVRDNIILTNQHVVSGAGTVTLKFSDGSQTQAQVVVTDPRVDLAALRVTKTAKPLALFTGRELPLGGSLIAVGHPKGLLFSVTRGVVSGVRDIQDVRYVQTDAPINPGNSGGPVIINGEVAGISDWKRTDSEGIGFAIHFSEVRGFLAKFGL